MIKPAFLTASIDAKRDYSSYSVRTFLGMDDEQLAQVDPLAMNLVVAREIPQLASLEMATTSRSQIDGQVI